MQRYSSTAARDFFELVFSQDAQKAAQLLRLRPDLARERNRPFGSTPLIEAARRGDAAMVLALLPHADPMAVDAMGRSALGVCAEWGSPSCVEILLRHAPQTQALIDAEGCAPLMRAALGAHPGCVKLLAHPEFCDIQTPAGFDALSLSFSSFATSLEHQLACVALLAPIASPQSLASALERDPPQAARALIQSIQCAREQALEIERACEGDFARAKPRL